MKESRRKDAKALSLIEVAMTEIVFPKISATNYAKEAWDILETNFKGIDKNLHSKATKYKEGV